MIELPKKFMALKIPDGAKIATATFWRGLREIDHGRRLLAPFPPATSEPLAILPSRCHAPNC